VGQSQFVMPMTAECTLVKFHSPSWYSVHQTSMIVPRFRPLSILLLIGDVTDESNGSAKRMGVKTSQRTFTYSCNWSNHSLRKNFFVVVNCRYLTGQKHRRGSARNLNEK
jgi:hypothetical protein